MTAIKISSLVLGVVIISVLLGLLVFFGYNMYVPKTGSAISNNPSDINVFEGKITNAKIAAGTTIEGMSAYDRNCVGSPMTECDGGISTAEYGTLNFHYRHSMSVQPCIHMFGSEKMIVQVLDDQGNAKVIRTQDLSGMAGHHG